MCHYIAIHEVRRISHLNRRETSFMNVHPQESKPFKKLAKPWGPKHPCPKNIVKQPLPLESPGET